MGGGITGFIQANDTDLHHSIKSLYRNEKMELMLKMLSDDKNKVPAPKQEDLINMLILAWENIKTDFGEVFKKGFVTDALDGSEDHLISDKIFSLIGNIMQDFQKSLSESPLRTSLLAVIKGLIPQKGIRRKNIEGS